MTASVRVDLGLGHVNIGLPDFPVVSAIGEKYGPAGGLFELREAVAQWENVRVDEISITTGASLGLASTLATLPRPCSVLCPRPYYPAYPKLAALLGLDLLFYDLEAEQGWLPVSSQVESLLRHDTRALLWNFPSNPTGSLPSANLVAEMNALAAQNDLLVLSDEVYAKLTYEDYQTLNARQGFEKDRVVCLRSFSKIFGIPGERLGYIVADPERVKAVSSAHWALAMSPPATAQLMALSCLHHAPDDRIRKLKKVLAASRRRATAILWSCPNAVVTEPAAGIFLWIEVRNSPLDSRAVSQACAETAGVIVAPGAVFGVDNPVFLRASFGLELEQVEQGFQALASFLRTF